MKGKLYKTENQNPKLNTSVQEIVEVFTKGYIEHIEEALNEARIKTFELKPYAYYEVKYCPDFFEEGLQLGIDDCFTQEVYDNLKEEKDNFIKENLPIILCEILKNLREKGYEFREELNGFYVISPSDKLLKKQIEDYTFN